MASAYRSWRWLQRVLLFILPNKMDLARERYFVVQNSYRGRALFGDVRGILLAHAVRADEAGMSAAWRG
jgi:hypothetical protein